jgi:peptidoglycan/xylan/chitin deacetylase (PgdA/CDA1 family)
MANQYESETSMSATYATVEGGATTSSGRGCFFNFCCFLLIILLLGAIATAITMGVDGSKHGNSAAPSSRNSPTPSASTGGETLPESNGASKAAFNPSSGGKEGTVKSFNWCGKNQKMAVLTFDDGPSVTATPNVLVDLKETGIKATFFMSPAVDGTPDSAKCNLVERILADGHSVQSHSWDHKDFANLTDVQVVANLNKNKEWLTSCAGNQIDNLNLNMFRPPYGSLDYVRAQYISNELGYTIATWNIETEDFRGGNADDIVQRIDDKYQQLIPDKKGSVIILMHDKTYIEGGSIGAIKGIKRYFDKLGYTFGTAGECYSGCDEYTDFCKMDGVWPGVFEQP